jgi:hypothetical protein
MRRIIGPILGVLGILLIFGLVAGIAYSAGLGAAGVVVTPGATTTVVPAVGYAWYAGPWFGLGHFLGFLLVFVLILALLRAAFGTGRRWGGGWGPGYGYGPGYRHGGRGWDHDRSTAAGGPGDSGDPREAWIRARLEEWHRTAHAGEAGATPPVDPTEPTPPPTAA